MIERHIIVSEKDHAWQYSYRGAATGPFKTKQDAIEDAIISARKVEDDRVEVILQESDLSQETVWRQVQTLESP
ncbi:MAG: hypothetical protein EOP22_07970 [Hyphomicrobiales bacterium]|nr:MAG: hypothetical protein EOP22_07970 [Hyphomicrobiales bacterium]